MAFNGANGRDHAWTHEEAIDAGLAWVERHGEPPTRTELDPALMRRQIRKAEERLEQLREREGRFEPGEMPGMAVIRRLFTGIDPYLTALGFTPRGTGRPPARMRSEHAAQAQRVLDALHAGHRQLLAFLDRSVAASESELRYQRERNGGEGRIETDLDELEAAGLVDAEVRVYYRLTSEGRRRLKSSEEGLELEELVA